jgi:hypothetical protein
MSEDIYLYIVDLFWLSPRSLQNSTPNTINAYAHDKNHIKVRRPWEFFEVSCQPPLSPVFPCDLLIMSPSEFDQPWRTNQRTQPNASYSVYSLLPPTREDNDTKYDPTSSLNLSLGPFDTQHQRLFSASIDQIAHTINEAPVQRREEFDNIFHVDVDELFNNVDCKIPLNIDINAIEYLFEENPFELISSAAPRINSAVDPGENSFQLVLLYMLFDAWSNTE